MECIESWPIPATTSSVVASSSAKGPPKQYPSKSSQSQWMSDIWFFLTKMKIPTDRLRCTWHPCLYSKTQVEIIFVSILRSTVNFPDSLNPLWKTFFSLLLGLGRPCSSVKTRFICMKVEWISKKVINPKDGKTFSKNQEKGALRQKSFATNHARHNNPAITEHWCKKGHRHLRGTR